MDYVRLYDSCVNSSHRENEVTLDFLITMMNKVENTTISSRDFKDEIITFCNRFNNKDYVFLIDDNLLDKIYNSYSFKRNIMNIINLYVNKFITFDDVKNGIKIKDVKIDKKKNNYNKLVKLNKTSLEDIQNLIVSGNYNNEKELSNYGFIIEDKKDVLFINNLINAYASGLLTLTEDTYTELSKFCKLTKLTMI
jgi:hypothetical protein